MTGIVTVVGRGLWRYMDTLTRTNQASMQALVVINEQFWEKMSPDYRAIIVAAAQLADAEARDIVSKIEADAYKELAAGKGVKIVDLTDDELVLWRICSSDVLQEFMNRGGQAGQDLMVAYGRLKEQISRTGTPRAETGTPATGRLAMQVSQASASAGQMPQSGR